MRAPTGVLLNLKEANMGFGLLLLGYMTALSFFPDFSGIYVYMWPTIFVTMAGGAIMLAAFIKLGEYNIYFKIMRYISVIYILVLIGLTPFLIMELSEEAAQSYIYISKIIKIFLLFAFHYFMLSGIYAMAKSIDNQRVLKSARINIYLTYIYFGASILGLFEFAYYYMLAVTLLGLIYYLMNLVCIYKCFTHIGYEIKGE